MANNKITFNLDQQSAYGVNLTILQGSNFAIIFDVKKENKSPFDLTDYTIYAKMKKSVAIGSSTGGITSFTTTLTDAANGQFALSMDDSVTSTLKPGRYYYDINVVTYGVVHKMVSGNVVVEGGLSI